MRKKFLISTILILTFLSGLILVGCEEKDVVSAQIYALDTVIDMTVKGSECDEALEDAKAEIRRLEKLFSVTDERSDIYRINHSHSESTAVSDESYELTLRAAEISALTDGKFDITVYSLVKLWGFTTGEYRVPDKTEISDTLLTVGYEKITLSDGNKVIVKEGTQLDLGGIAKGYIADKVAEVIKSRNVEYGIISLGGNVRTVGKKPSGEDFTVGINHPNSGNYFALVNTKDVSIITSGGYQRNFTEDGKIYHHIIDTNTGYPAESDIVSVTVIGKDGTLCDALSTAIFIGGTQYAYKLHSTTDEFDYVILTKDNKIIASQNLSGKLTTADGYDNITIEYR